MTGASMRRPDGPSLGSNVVKKTLIFAASLALLAAAAAQAATPADSVPSSLRVSYRDLDLNNPSDATIMLQRLRDAALQACGAFPGSFPDYRRAVEASACYKQSLDRAVNDLGVPAVSQLYQGSASVASE